MQLNEHFRFKSRWRPQSNTASVMGLISSSFWKVPVRGFKVECFSPGGYRGERDGERDNGFRGDRGGPRGPRPGDRDREYRGGPRGTGNSGPRGGSGRPYPRSNGFHESGTQWATTSATSDSVKQQIKEETNKTEKALQSVFSIKKSRWKKTTFHEKPMRWKILHTGWSQCSPQKILVLLFQDESMLFFTLIIFVQKVFLSLSLRSCPRSVHLKAT